MGTETVAAQLSDDSKLWDEFDEFQSDYQNKSEAVRVALRRGMKANDARPGNSRLGERMAWGTLAFSLAALSFGQSSLAGVVALLAGIVFIGTALYRWRDDK
jgi:hypothetical protein